MWIQQTGNILDQFWQVHTNFGKIVMMLDTPNEIKHKI